MLNSNPAQRATLAFIAPFLGFVGIMALERVVPLPAQWLYLIRFTIVLALICFLSRPYLSLRPSFPLTSIGVGLAVFVIWVATDVLFDFRHHWLFENWLTGPAASSLPVSLKRNFAFILLRCISSCALIPIVEELFWRGWLMRWLIDKNFLKVPLGQYVPSAFWTVALLFALEHGPYWDVGLAAGIVYNWWIVRARNLADCILAHAVTNAVLAAYVLWTDQWQYWL